MLDTFAFQFQLRKESQIFAMVINRRQHFPCVFPTQASLMKVCVWTCGYMYMQICTHMPLDIEYLQANLKRVISFSGYSPTGAYLNE